MEILGSGGTPYRTNTLGVPEAQAKSGLDLCGGGWRFSGLVAHPIGQTPLAFLRPKRRVDLICVVEDGGSQVWWHTLQDKHPTKQTLSRVPQADLICVMEGADSRVWWHLLQDKHPTGQTTQGSRCSLPPSHSHGQDCQWSKRTEIALGHTEDCPTFAE